MASTPKQVNGLNNGPLGKRKKPQRSKGSYLTKWLDKTMQHIQDSTPSMDTYDPFVNYNWTGSQFAPGYEPCRYNNSNVYGCAEPMSLPTLPTYYNPPMPPFYSPEYRYNQTVNKSIQVQRPRPRRRVDIKAEEVNTTPNSTLSANNYLQPKNFTDNQDFASLPPIVTSVADTNSNCDMNSNDKDDGSNNRRYSDPCVRGLPDVARPANGEAESDCESNSSFTGSQIGSRLLGHLLDQIASLKLANERLNKDLMNTKGEFPSYFLFITYRQYSCAMHKIFMLGYVKGLFFFMEERSVQYPSMMMVSDYCHPWKSATLSAVGSLGALKVQGNVGLFLLFITITYYSLTKVIYLVINDH